MNNAEYEVFEVPFREAARPLLEQLRQRLTDAGRGPFTEVDIVDKDVDRGLGFDSVENPEKEFVELMLHDGAESGYEGVGLSMSCSSYALGQVWAPGNYTTDVGATTVEELIDRLKSLDVGAATESILSEWDDLPSRDDQKQTSI